MCIRDSVHVRLVLLEVSHQRLVADIVDEVIPITDIMNAYRFVEDLRENVLWVDQEKIKFCMAKLIGYGNNSIKKVALAEDEVNRFGREKPFLLQMAMGRVTNRGSTNNFNGKRSVW